MGLPVSPLHPPRDVQDGLRDGDANALKEHDQVVVAPGGAEALVASAPRSNWHTYQLQPAGSTGTRGGFAKMPYASLQKAFGSRSRGDATA